MTACLAIVNQCAGQIKGLKQISGKEKRIEKRNKRTYLQMKRKVVGNILTNNNEIS